MTENDIDATAQAFFLVKIANGAVPKEAEDGKLDGLRYFEVEIDGVSFWLTETGLMAPRKR